MVKKKIVTAGIWMEDMAGKTIARLRKHTIFISSAGKGVLRDGRQVFKRGKKWVYRAL